MTEPTDWVGGQLTSQAVPPDEHPWIEQCGCTATYREFRDQIRNNYAFEIGLTKEAERVRALNPGQGWVSRLCFEPWLGERLMLGWVAESDCLVLVNTEPVMATVVGESIVSVELQDLADGNRYTIEPRFVLDATEMGDLLPLAGAEYRIGAESRRQTGEEHAIDGDPEPENVQGITWCFAMGWDPTGEHVTDKPAQYEKWKAFAPDFWPGSILSWKTIHAHTGEPFEWTLFASEHERGMGLFDYRQVVSTKVRRDAKHDATIVNWPQNDYYEATTLDVEPDTLTLRLESAKQLSLSLMYWLQTEAPRPDGGAGYPGLYMDGKLTGTKDGFAKAPYIRESRRMETLFTVLEKHVSAHDNPGKTMADKFWDSVGIGAYRIDLHPSANGRPTVDFSALPFQIPLGALIPIRIKNLLPACKNLGVTHITNGCYRLHPVEWNVGEAAGALAAFCLEHDWTPAQVYEDRAKVAEFQNRLVEMGVELSWPEFHPL